MLKGLIKMPSHIDYRDRFINQVESLIKRGIVGKQAEIAAAIGYDPTSLTNVLKKRRPLPQSVYKRFTEVYNLEPMVVATDENDDYRAKYVASLESQIKLLESQLSLAQGEARHIAVMNFSMLKVMRKTMAQVLAKVEKSDPLTVAGKIDKETSAYYRSVREKGSLIDLDI